MPNIEDIKQDTIINFLEKRLDKIDTLLESCATKRDLDRIIESYNRRIGMLTDTDKEAREDIDIHCHRINEIKENVSLIGDTTKNNNEFIKDIQGKIFYGFFVLLGLLGTIILAAFEYFNKK